MEILLFDFCKTGPKDKLKSQAGRKDERLILWLESGLAYAHGCGVRVTIAAFV